MEPSWWLVAVALMLGGMFGAFALALLTGPGPVARACDEAMAATIRNQVPPAPPPGMEYRDGKLVNAEQYAREFWAGRNANLHEGQKPDTPRPGPDGTPRRRDPVSEVLAIMRESRPAPDHILTKRDEVMCWATFAAEVSADPDVSVFTAAQWADDMLAQLRQRFGRAIPAPPPPPELPPEPSARSTNDAAGAP